MNLMDTHWAIILPTIAMNVPFGTFLLSGFIKDIPGSLLESAKIDGASEWKTLWRIVAPIIKPGVNFSADLCIYVVLERIYAAKHYGAQRGNADTAVRSRFLPWQEYPEYPADRSGFQYYFPAGHHYLSGIPEEPDQRYDGWRGERLNRLCPEDNDKKHTSKAALSGIERAAFVRYDGCRKTAGRFCDRRPGSAVY